MDKKIGILLIHGYGGTCENMKAKCGDFFVCGLSMGGKSPDDPDIDG